MGEGLTNSNFFETLSNFYENTRESGSVWITIKRVPAEKYQNGEINERRPFSCLVRAKIDDKYSPSNIFTIVSPSNVVQFSNQLAGIMKHKCTNLVKEE